MKSVTQESYFEINNERLKIQSSISGCYIEMLKAIYGEMNAIRERHCKILAVRIDLHMSHYTENNKAISELMRKLKKRLKNKYKGITMGYVWAREIEKAKQQHYHLLLIFDGNKVRAPKNIIPIIEEIWMIHDHPKPYTPKNCYYFMTRDDAEKFQEAFYRASYLAKARGKGYKSDKANDFNSSRLRYNCFSSQMI